MKFSDEMLEKVLSGEKTVTRRLYYSYCEDITGRRLAAQDSKGKMRGLIKILSFRIQHLFDIERCDGDLEHEGFAGSTFGDFYVAFWEFYPQERGQNSWVVRLEFELVEVCE